MKHADHKNILKGVSTPGVMKNKFKVLLFLIILTAFSADVFGGHSTLDIVDPNFNPNIQTNSYGFKWVNQIQALPDGKLLALGGFNNYNGVPVGKLIRLNPDGSLDPTFHNQTVTDAQSFEISAQILIQSDGKIVLKCSGLVAGGQGPKQLLRLDADGTFDATFNFTQSGSIFKLNLDSSGRLVLMGDFTTPKGARRLIRLNNDGSLDNSFDFTLPADTTLQSMTVQGDKPIVMTEMSNNRRIYRLNEDGSTDASFTPLTGTGLSLGDVQPNNKILYQIGLTLLRLNENGASDDTFQPTTLTQVINPLLLKFTSDGKIVITNSGSPATFRRFLTDGGADPSFNPNPVTFFASYTIQFADNIVMGDGMMGGNGGLSNKFVRLTSAGELDPTFNPGGTGFQNVLPGVIESIETSPDGKTLLGGKFDLINDVACYRLARLNADSTVDSSFQVNTSGTGNYFAIIRDVYQIHVQADGKMVVSGFFDYVLGGVTKKNLVRLNSDGSIDPSFNLIPPIFDASQILLGGQNRFATYSDGKLIIGAAADLGGGVASAPLRLTTGGARDTSFNPTLNGTAPTLYYDDVAIQPDGKIVGSGSYANSSNVFKSFVARFNPDGSLDPTFIYSEEPDRLKSRLALLPGNKILISKSSHPGGGSARLQRLNFDGTLDSSFNPVLLADTSARINALLVLPNGKIFIGGKFTVTVNGQQNRNLLQLDADGHFEPTTYTLNDEVLCLAADSEGRVLVGGGFTVIDANGAGATRSYVARLTDSRTRFDFDGDGKADLGLFSNADGSWTINNSRTNQTLWAHFGLSGDKTVAADYDGDGRADIAVFRPSTGVWYLLRSSEGFGAVQWGLGDDKPVAGDYDGDGRADIAVWRPSSGVWYVLQSSNNQLFAVGFGLAGDIPLAQTDYDGDGRADISVWRPSDGNFYWLPSSLPGQYRVVHFGMAGDVPAAADYNGDGRADLVVFRPSEGNWYQYLTTPSGGYLFAVTRFGLNGDVPVPADYDGDGRADIAVRRQNLWHILRSAQGYTVSVFGTETDTAIAALPVE
jgi:uncharacterized delta-60 repeat protein